MNTPRRRLLFVTAHASRAGGGVAVATRDLARMMMQDFDVRVLALVDGPTRAEDEPEWQGIDVTSFSTTGPRRYGLSFALLFAVLRARSDVVHVHGLWQFHCFAVLILHLVRRKPYVVTPHGMLERWIVARSPRLKRIIAGSYQNRFLRSASAIHVLTPQEGDDVVATIGDARCVVIPNIVAPVERVQARPDWWEPAFDDRDIFLFLGRLHSKKGCLELCEAWERLNRENRVFRDRSVLVFCGVIDDLPAFEDRIRILTGQFGNIRYAGPQYGEDKHRSLAAATFFCLPSKSEGLPLAVIEAWLFGVPVIMTPECNLAIGFERHAAIETGSDAGSIMAGLAQASALSTERRYAMGNAALALVCEHFSIPSVGAAYRNLYEEVATT